MMLPLKSQQFLLRNMQPQRFSLLSTYSLLNPLGRPGWQEFRHHLGVQREEEQEANKQCPLH